jgi:hypothetical protein
MTIRQTPQTMSIINKMTSITWSISKHEQLHGFLPDARTFHNIYKLQKHVLLRHQSYLIAFTGNTNLRFGDQNRFMQHEC